jgi:hypothetical protein
MRAAGKTGGNCARRDQSTDTGSWCGKERKCCATLQLDTALVMGPPVLLVEPFGSIHRTFAPEQRVFAVDQPHIGAVGRT